MYSRKNCPEPCLKQLTFPAFFAFLYTYIHVAPSYATNNKIPDMYIQKKRKKKKRKEMSEKKENSLENIYFIYIYNGVLKKQIN